MSISNFWKYSQHYGKITGIFANNSHYSNIPIIYSELSLIMGSIFLNEIPLELTKKKNKEKPYRVFAEWCSK